MKFRNDRGQFIKKKTGVMFEGHAVYFDKKGYACIWKDGKNKKIHVLVWEKANGIKPEGYEIHHKDENKANWELSNLELLSKSDHRKIHSGWIKTDGEWTHKPCTKCNRILLLSEFYNRDGHTPSAQCKHCHCKQTRKWAIKNPKKRKEICLNYYYKKKKLKEVPHA